MDFCLPTATRFGCSTTAGFFCFIEPVFLSARLLNFSLLSLLQLEVGLLSIFKLFVITEFDFRGSSLDVSDPLTILFWLPSNEGRANVRSSILRVAKSVSFAISFSTLST